MERVAGVNPSVGVPLRLGSFELSTNLLLAPVSNYCDLATRIMCRGWGGLGLACTDLLSPQGLLRGTAHSLDLARTHELDRPICMQLYGGDAGVLAEGAVWAVDHGADVVDINMGCPVDKVTKKDGGSKLLCDPPRTLRIAERVVRAVEGSSGGRVPVTAKLRLGWYEGCHVAPYMARRLERAGIAGVTVHGRTTAQRFSGEVDLDGIGEVVESVERIPVIGNGDVRSAWDALRMMEATGCAGVMIGRGAFSRPWVFRDAWSLQCAGVVPPEPSDAEKAATVIGYLESMLSFRDEHYAMTHVRRRISWFAKGMGACKPLRERVRTAATPDDVRGALREWARGGLRSGGLVEGGEAFGVGCEIGGGIGGEVGDGIGVAGGG